MNKVLHDQPDDPLIYLIKALHKKAGLEVPRDLRPSAVRKGSPERMGNFIHAKSKIKNQMELFGFLRMKHDNFNVY